MFGHRLQILLDGERYDKLSREADRRGISIAAVIREAIDGLPLDRELRSAAIATVLAAEPMDVPADPAELRRELDEAYDRATE